MANEMTKSSSNGTNGWRGCIRCKQRYMSMAWDATIQEEMLCVACLTELLFPHDAPMCSVADLLTVAKNANEINFLGY